MPVQTQRIKAAAKAAIFHLCGSALIASLGAVLVLRIWYPYPYSRLAGGLDLFLIMTGVDVVCGPMLTLILFNPRKRRRELVTDLSLVAVIQLAALVYGVYSVQDARPLFLAHEVDRFRVIAMPDYGDADVRAALAALPPPLRPHWYRGPVTVGLREPTTKEHNQVLFESVAGGRDYSQRPEFYIPYDAAYRGKVLARAKPLSKFTGQYPATASAAADMLSRHGVALGDALFLPVPYRQAWVAVLDKSGDILGFLPGDGFAVP
jgi:hypothetical protein